MQIDMSVPDDFCQGYDPERLSLPEDVEVDFPPEDKIKIKFKPFKAQRD